MTTKTLPSTVTTLDLIKTFAVICMIIDHIGFYFFPDSSWFRVVGRLGGAPIWFFLIGYASSREIPNMWMIGALILAVMDLALFGHVFSLNVLVTLILLRLTIDPIMNFMMQSRYVFWLGAVLLTFFYVPSNMLMEYGTIGVLCGMLGYIVKNRKELERITFLTRNDYLGFVGLIIVANTLLQSAIMGFDQVQSLCLGVAFAAITIALCQLRVETIPQITNKWATKTLHLGGRKTLEIYVGHLVVFKLVFWGLVFMGFYR